MHGVIPLRLLLPKTTKTKVKVLLGVAMETVGEDGHVALITPVSSAEKQRKYSHQHRQVLIVREEATLTQCTGTCPLWSRNLAVFQFLLVERRQEGGREGGR